MKQINLPPSKLFFTIGEVADMFDVNTSLVRFWEKEFSIIKPKKNKKGNRLFTPQDIESFQLIYYLVKEQGLTLKGAKKKLLESTDDTVKTMKVVEKLSGLREKLVAIKDNM